MNIARFARHMLFLAAVGLPTSLLAQEPGGTAGPTILMPGDSIRITVWRFDQFSGQFVVAPDGTISHPLYRDVHVGGLTLPEVEESVRQVLETYVDRPQFVVEPLLLVAVGGEVNRPGMYGLPPDATFRQAIARAGGPTQWAKRNKVWVGRYDAQGAFSRIRVDMTDLSDPWINGRVLSGDQILIDRKTFGTRDVIALIGAMAAVALVVERFVNPR